MPLHKHLQHWLRNCFKQGLGFGAPCLPTSLTPLQKRDAQRGHTPNLILDGGNSASEILFLPLPLLSRQAQFQDPFLETILACRCEGVGLPRSFCKLPGLPRAPPRTSPNFPVSSLATSPELLSLWIFP